MKTLYFKCTLLTDVILNQSAATTTNQETLDFIPGNNFLGIAAGGLYDDGKTEGRLSGQHSLRVFHSGEVRFGDAHPACISGTDGSMEIKRSLRIPASYYKPKLDNKDGFYIYHEVKNQDDPEYVKFQPKQCRKGFYVFENQRLIPVPVGRSFAIKSAYDRTVRRSAKEKMFGYESLQQGSVWIFDVSFDSNDFIEKVKEALIGTKRIGRSRTAQYGLVKIEILENAKKPIYLQEKNPDYALVYADARLIFLDQYGLPTFQPEASDLGFANGEIDWKKTQIRTFQYAPWNFKRQARDTDRCGIEKGSVFYIRKKEDNSPLIYPDTLNQFVGYYQNEGFGKTMINPDFLNASPDKNGKTLYTLHKEERTVPEKREETYDDPLFRYLKRKEQELNKERMIYKQVNDFVSNERNRRIFTADSFASQWGSIRNIAFTSADREDLKEKLLGKDGYLMHGTAAEKWNQGGRLVRFRKFLNEVDNIPEFNDRDIRNAIINLAAEMAKISGGK